MSYAVIDLALSEDEDAPPAAQQMRAPAPNRTANILQMALARAGGAQFRQPQARQQVLQQARQALYGTPQFGSLQSSYQFENVVLAVAGPKLFRIASDSRMPQSVNAVANATPEAQFKDDCWLVPLDKYQTTVYALTQAGVRFEPIPPQVLSALSAADDANNDWQAGNSRMDEEGYAKGDQDDTDAVSDVPRSVWRALAPFQRYGVSWIVKNNGRALLADEPGLGKTIQAIGAACAYYHEWPLLIVCPSSARFHWEHEFRTWLPDDDYIPGGESGVLVVTSQVMAPDIANALIVIVSYDLAHRDTVCDALYKMRPNVVICDESHYLKNGKARRTLKLMPLLTGAKRCVLMSGTPALSRPSEIFTQLSAIDNIKWNDPHLFSKRYCQSRRVKKEGQEDYTHASNIEELHTLLTASIMLRRIKSNILKQLPKKKRLTKTVEVEDKTLAAELKADLEEFRERASELAELSTAAKRDQRKRPRAASFVEEEKPVGGVIDIEAQNRREMAQQKKALLMSLFRRTGPAKLPAAENRIKELLSDEAGEKILVFAHHRSVLNYLSQGVLRTVPHIVINGSTAPRDRQTFATKFQTDPRVRVAVLGITAAGIALTLTAASRVIFTELYWTPAALLQAEDRAHRIGQTAEVKVEYLLAPDTVDDLLWPLVQHKMKLLGELFDNDKEHGLEEAEKRVEKEESSDDDEEHRFSEDESVGGIILDDELEALDREDEDAKDVARVADEEDGRTSPPPPPPVVAPLVNAQAALFDDDNFVF